MADVFRLGVLVIGRKRPGFDAQWGKTMEAAAYKALAATGVKVVKAALPSVDDSTIRSGMVELREQSADAVVVLQPTMGDGRLAPILAQACEVPLILWATPERPEVEKVTACSLVGAHAWGATLRQLNRAFEIVYADPLDEDAGEKVVEAAYLTYAAGRFPRCKVGLVGYHAPGFIDMHADPFTISRTLGLEMHHFSVDEFCQMADAFDEEAVREDVDRALALELPMDPGLTRDDLVPNSRFHLAMNRLMLNESLDALALRCWPEIPNRYGHWPYLAMARLTDAGQVVALEGDVDGALMGLLGRLMGIGPGYISDWLEHDSDTITLWHPGHAPLSVCEEGSVSLSRHFNDNKPLVLDAELKANEPITLARLWRCDGDYHMVAIDARTTTPARHFHGCSGLAMLDIDVPALFDELVHEGMPHHLTIFPGHQTEQLRKLSRLIHVEWLGQ